MRQEDNEVCVPRKSVTLVLDKCGPSVFEKCEPSASSSCNFDSVVKCEFVDRKV